MGHFSMTCSASGLPISGGTPVRCLLLVASPYNERGDSGSSSTWVARTPPLRAVYNDYGTIEDIHEGDKAIADLWLRGLQEDLVVKGLGDNSYHDLPTDKSMTLDQLLDALRAGRVEVHQDAHHFWRRPVDDSWMEGLKDESLPMFKRVGKVVATIGKVASDAGPDTYVVDEPVPNLVRVRFGKYQHDAPHQDALVRAKEAVEKAGYTATIGAGSGRYPDSADLIVLNLPNKDQHFKGAQWDRAAGQKSADDKRLSVRLAMVREDVWQELIAYPRSQYVSLDCIHCGQSPSYHGGEGKSERECPNESINDRPFKVHEEGSSYAHGPVFPEEVEHVVTKGSYGSEYAWFGLAAFKHNIRNAWKEILAYFDRNARIERGEKVEPTEEEQAEEKKISPEIEKLFAGFEAKRKEEEQRIAALPQEEQDKIKAEQKAAAEKREKARQDRLDNPVFGDFHISDFVLPHRHNDVGTWIFRHELPGVLGIPDHLSMCLADKKEVTTHLLDAIAELAAFQYAMRDVGCVWKPAASTGPQDPEWREQARFHATLLAIARKQSAKYTEDRGDHALHDPGAREVTVTADTITDDQIRALHDGTRPVSDALHELCRVALNAAVGSLRRAQARGQLADLLNGKDVKIPLNAVTITDDEIRKLMATTDRDTRKLCEIALRDPHAAKTRGAMLMMARRKGEARARLAEILSNGGVFAEILPGRSSK